MKFPGIDLRARVVDLPPDKQLILWANSTQLHNAAKLMGATDEWRELLPPITKNGEPWLVIEFRSVEFDVYRHHWWVRRRMTAFRRDRMTMREVRRRG